MRTEIGKGAAWMVLVRLFDRTVGIAGTLILARLLVPADFGLVAMPMSIGDASIKSKGEIWRWLTTMSLLALDSPIRQNEIPPFRIHS